MRNRKPDEIRNVEIIPNYQKKPYGSALIKQGDTVVLCSAQVIENVPDWLKEQNSGWLTAEYSMLPGSSETRIFRDRGHVNGRSKEIERIIGRCLRAAVDLKKLGPRTIWIDCDVIQADGGTRTASITAGFVALSLAIRRLMKEGKLGENPIKYKVAAISAGIVNGEPLLDLAYEEDSQADVDINIAMNEEGKYIEIQGTSEKEPLSRENLNILLDLAEKGIKELFKKQEEALNV
ncbi:ribonuclease PH [Candidatus Aciduliprofundum boonei]|uniref:Ribonuclease PH n=1 Tax=Aciduliprofundum boonei (strain DSM 19572 / T469) TaxID=439481 RepID=B5IAD2_ACIB4|nr:ribonuclease PH [Candidatus Aciduliprofundum boonei]ADD08224.1 ribonuclease PH [Aciduliprofundum boonei T469]EDY35126.1 ribonuclease PH [Aciduliprofundum boonei T469]EDY37101.1 ribonuclease PH [Aciduliprofundum boonei T469]HII55776.1 ribonuclease PH [Candidatus Aciduliprofundum boonei]